MPAADLLQPIQAELLRLYIGSAGYFPYSDQNPLPIQPDELKDRLPLIYRYWVTKAEMDWSRTFTALSRLAGGSNYLRVEALCKELTGIYAELQPKVRVGFHSLSQLDLVTYQIVLQVLHLMTISAETVLEFTLKHLALIEQEQKEDEEAAGKKAESKAGNISATLRSNPILEPIFSPETTIPKDLVASPHFNVALIADIFTSDDKPFPQSILLCATMAGQFENVRALAALPMTDINARAFFLPTTVRNLAKERVSNSERLPDISKPVVPGVNPATVPYSPNKLLPCPPFPWDTVTAFLTTRLVNAAHNHHPVDPIAPAATTVPLTQSYPLMSLYYSIMNQFGSCLYAASSLINGTNNRYPTRRQKLILRDPVLYADEDSSYYPPAPPSEISPWFFPPSSPTPVLARSQQRSASGGRTPLIRWVYVAPEGSWRTLQDEEIIPFREDPATKSGTYMIASQKQPRTLFTDAMDLVSFFLATGAEMVLPLVSIGPSQAKDGGIPDQAFSIVAPLPLTIQDTLPNNALTASARIAVRLGLVRYQRWCNNTTNVLLDAFMSALGFDRLRNKAYHRYNGHHWPYAYLKRYNSSETKQDEATATTLVTASDSTPHSTQPSAAPTLPRATNLIGNARSGIIRDITKDPIYLSLFSLVMTTRTTQIKLGIQDVPTAVTYNPVIPKNVARVVRQYKRALRLQQGQPPKLAVVTNQQEDELSSGRESGDENEALLAATSPAMEIVPQHLLAPDLSALALPPRTHVPSSNLPKGLSLLHWFLSYHFTQKHFVDIAKKAMPKTGPPSNSTKKSSSAAPAPSFGKASGQSSVRRELERRAALIRDIEAQELQRQEQETALKHLMEDSTTATSTAPSSEPNPAKPLTRTAKPAAKPKLSQQDLDDIMGPSKKKKPKVKTPAKPAPIPVESTVETPEQAEPPVAPVLIPEVVIDAKMAEPSPALDAQSPAAGIPDYDQDLILDPANFPKPLLFNNFYDSDDNLPLLMSLSRYHSAATTPGADDSTSHVDGKPRANIPSFTQPCPELKKAIDNTIISPYFQTAPQVEQILLESYKSETSSVDPFTRLFPNQLVLGSIGHISMEFLTPKETLDRGFVIAPIEAPDMVSTPATTSLRPTTKTCLNPVFSEKDSTKPDQPPGGSLQPADTLNLISHDHFLTKEMSQALEMASTLSSIVMLYCGQNTHRGYTDLQYSVKIGQPTTQMR